MDASLAHRTVLVLGATGRVGAALVHELAARDARVGIAVRREWQVARVEQALAAAGVPRDRHLVGVVGDDDAEAAAGLVKGVEDALGPIAAFISAAGAHAAAPLGDEDARTATDLWRANFASTHTLARAVVMPMRRRRAGSLVFTGAAVALDPTTPNLALYLASKAALHAYATSLAAELASHGIRVTVLAPGPIAELATDVGGVTYAAVARRLVELTESPAPSTIVPLTDA